MRIRRRVRRLRSRAEMRARIRLSAALSLAFFFASFSLRSCASLSYLDLEGLEVELVLYGHASRIS